MIRRKVPYDGNSAVAHVAYATNEIIAIYPITPSSPMGEICDEKTIYGERNIFGSVPVVTELQSEAGVAGTIHGALTTGALATTFTSSQGLLLMIPNMYKIAGELLPTVFHIAARSIACQALSIFGDHSDVMACRATGWAMLASSNVQESMDFALIAQAATLESRIPFIHFFEGFRISHEIQKIEELTLDDMKTMISDGYVKSHRSRGLNPEHPFIRGTSQNPDIYFQGRESVNKYYSTCPDIVQKTMDKFSKITGRQYKLFDYTGAPNAERIIVVMGSGGEIVNETVDYLIGKGEKVGLIKVRLFRPFDISSFVNSIPLTVKKIAVLDRTKEPGALGEPLYEDIRTAISEAMEQKLLKLSDYPKIVGGRFGLGSAEFTPAMVISIFENLSSDNSKNHFTAGIEDDITQTSLDYNKILSIEKDSVYRAILYALGSDGTVSANKNTIKIIADTTDNYVQGYFEYDSKKAGTVTVSYIRIAREPIRSSYLITSANFIACHNFSFLYKFDVLKNAKERAIFLLTSSYNNKTWDYLPNRVKKQIVDKKIKFYVIDAIKIAEDLGLGSRINTIMQAAFFKISRVIDEASAINGIKDTINKTYSKKGDRIIKINLDAVEKALTSIEEIKVPMSFDEKIEEIKVIPDNSPEFVKKVTSKILKREGASVKVSEIPADGTWPSGTAQYEKRNIAVNIPEWNPENCIQCGRCSLVCPHASIRMKMFDTALLKHAPEEFKSIDAKGKETVGKKFALQVSPEDCTGCSLCVSFCPVKEKGVLKMVPQSSVKERESNNYKFFLNLPETDSKLYDGTTLKGTQFIQPLFEYSGACAGCGETPYIKLLTQLFGDRLIIANATGCSSIYGGNLPTTPYTKRKDGRGPAWINSLFEDNAEVALGMRLTIDKFSQMTNKLADKIIKGACKNNDIITLCKQIKAYDQSEQNVIEEMYLKVKELKSKLKECSCSYCSQLIPLTDYFVKKSIWAIGGDGWAYDIGYGGLDHVLASRAKVNMLVLDTEVYSNTGGQASKSTPLGAVAKFASAGKRVSKKDMAIIFMSYGYIYVAKIALGADPNQAIKAIIEAEKYDGPSLIIAYSHCIAHGIDMASGLYQQKKAVESGHWQLLRYNPELVSQGKNPLILDSGEPKISFSDYASNENRYNMLKKIDSGISNKLLMEADKSAKEKYKLYKILSEMGA